jgi:hypothetical protein
MALIEKLNAIGDAIRGKTGGTDKLTLAQMAEAIAGIQTGGGVRVVTGTVTFAEDTTAHDFLDEEPDVFVLYKEDSLGETHSAAQGIWATVMYKQTDGTKVRYTFGYNKGSKKYYAPDIFTTSGLTIGRVQNTHFNSYLLPATYRYFGIYGTTV